MKIDYWVYDPSGNITVLASPEAGSELSGAALAEAARRLMEAVPEAEQVGFIRPVRSAVRGRLQMAGGEFCGNAAMSLGVHLAHGIPPYTDEIPLEVSGASGTVRVRVTVDAEGNATGEVDMPLPESISLETFPGDILDGKGTEKNRPLSVPVVHMPGIDHVIVPCEGALSGTLDTPALEQAFQSWMQQLHAPAFGLILLDEDAAAIRPLVCVPDAGTSIWERACGSGSAAVAAWLATQRRASTEIALAQPGGSITARATLQGGKLHKLTISGSVRFVRSGQIEL
ncbi:MAG: hypothetical protein LBD12_00760 [Clostridiales Family XIII bacterium]|jgi:diaminopimelate epimerase|nr:hypothetical protein [Clostridiales Family XIII bacterium]